MEQPPASKPVTSPWQSESYAHQSRHVWPGRGQHILAQCGVIAGEEAVCVYQLYNKTIADYAVEQQKFEGCPVYNHERMTWVKTNFLWAMYRGGWCQKHNQERLLGLWIRRARFELYLEHARTKGHAPRTPDFSGAVRLQWDPDHLPNGDAHPYRRAIQLGLKGVTTFINGQDVLLIEDLTPFVEEQERVHNDTEKLMVARERVFVPISKEAAKAVELSPPPKEGTEENDNNNQAAGHRKKK